MSHLLKRVSVLQHVINSRNQTFAVLRNWGSKDILLRKGGPIANIVRSLQTANEHYALHKACIQTTKGSLTPSSDAVKSRASQPHKHLPPQPTTIDPPNHQNVSQSPLQTPIQSSDSNKNEKTSKTRTYEDLNIHLGSQIDAHTKQEFENLITDYSDVFALSNSELSGCNLGTVELRLKDPNSKPVRGPTFSHPIEEREIISAKIDELLADGFIEPSSSPYSCSCFLVSKKEGGHRLVFDFRKVNKLLEPEIYCTPTMSEILQKLGGAKARYYSCLDLRSVYNQLIISEGSRQYVAFTTSRGHFQFKRAPYGVSVLPAIFQRLMVSLISKNKFLQERCVIFLDDLMIYSENISAHKKALEILFQLMRDANLKLHPGKCTFLKTEVSYIGHVFSNGTFQPDKQKVQHMLSFKRPHNKATLKAYISLLSYYRQFLRNFAIKVSPLQDLLKKDAKFVWNDSQEQAYQELQTMLKTIPVLTIPDESSPYGYVIHCDSSSKAIAFTISQKGNDNQDHLLACYSRSLRPFERKFPIHEKEIMSLLVACVKYRHLLMSNKPITIYSDSLTVRYLQTLKASLNMRLIRWSIALDAILSRAEFRHIPSHLNVVADSLSRLETVEQPEITEEEEQMLFDGDRFVSTLQSCLDEEISDSHILHKEELDCLCSIINDSLDTRNFLNSAYYSEGETTELEDNALDSEINLIESPNFLNFQRSCLALTTNNPTIMSIEYKTDKTVFPSEITQSVVDCNVGSVLDEISQVIDKIYGNLNTAVERKQSNDELCQIKCTTESFPNDLLSIGKLLDDDTMLTDGRSLSDKYLLSSQANEQLNTNHNKILALDSSNVSLSNPVSQTTQINDVCLSNLSKLQDLDMNLKQLKDFLKNGSLPLDNDKLCRKIIFDANCHFINEFDELCFLKPNKNKITQDLWEHFELRVVPRSIVTEVIDKFHKVQHSGIGKTTQTILKYFYWPGMWSDIKHFVSTCKNCIISKRLAPYKTTLRSFSKPLKVFEQLHFDVLELNTLTKNNNRSLLVVVCAFSNYCFLLPCPNTQAETIASKLMQVFAHTGVVKTLVSDKAASFCSNVMKHLWNLLGIKHVTVASYHSKSNARVERMNRTIAESLRTNLKDDQLDTWDETALSIVQLGLNTYVSDTLPISPFQVVHGFQAQNMYDLGSDDTLASESVPDYVAKVKERINVINKVQQKVIARNELKMTEAYNKKFARPYYDGYRIGQKVWLKHEPTVQNVSAKFKRTYLPDIFKVISIDSFGNLQLQNCNTGKMMKNVVHVDRVHPHVERKELNKTQNQNSAESCDRESIYTKAPVLAPESSVSNRKLSQPTEDSSNRDEVQDTAVNIDDHDYDKAQIVKQKLMNGEKFFYVRLPNNTFYWVSHNSLPDEVIKDYYKTHTLAGKKRKRARRRAVVTNSGKL